MTKFKVGDKVQFTGGNLLGAGPTPTDVVGTVVAGDYDTDNNDCAVDFGLDFNFYYHYEQLELAK